MGKKDQKENINTRVEAVLELLKKQAPLTVKQVVTLLPFFFFFPRRIY